MKELELNPGDLTTRPGLVVTRIPPPFRLTLMLKEGGGKFGRVDVTSQPSLSAYYNVWSIGLGIGGFRLFSL